MNAWVLSLFWCLWSGVWHNANRSQAHLQSLIKPYYLPCSVDYLQEEKQLVLEPLLHTFSKLVVQGLARVLTAYEKHCGDKHVMSFAFASWPFFKIPSKLIWFIIASKLLFSQLLLMPFYVFRLSWCRSTPNYGYKMKAETWIDSVLSDKSRYTMIKETTKAEKEFSALQLRNKWWFRICWCGSVQSKKEKKRKKSKENTEKKVGWMGLLWQEWYGLGDKGRVSLQLPAKQALSIFQLKLYFTFSVLEWL